MAQTNYQDLQIQPVEAEAFALQYYNLSGKARALPGEVDFNFYFKTVEGAAYTLKISRPEVDLDEIDFQWAIMDHLRLKALPLTLPHIIPTTDQKSRIQVSDAVNRPRWMRMQSWVPGRMLVEVNPHTAHLLQSLGAACGHLSRGLVDFEHAYAHREYLWDPSQALASQKFRAFIHDKQQLALADYAWSLFESHQEQLSTLRKSINHNDAHDYNVLVSKDLENPAVSGIIDFGDALHTHTINELAIPCAYACMHKADPLESAMQLLKGYHEVFPVQESELAVLFPLILARLVISVAHSAKNKQAEPDNPYLLVSEKPAWELLQQLREIPPAYAHYAFRQACGFEPCPQQKIFVQWENAHADKLCPPIPVDPQAMTVMDLSVGSLDLGNNSRFEGYTAFQKTINQILGDAEVGVGLGGYGEIRPFYSTDAYALKSNNGPVWRTVHLGHDVWVEAGTAVHAFADAKVYSIQNNAGERDYGPTIILEHRVSESLTFYSLYGHLSLESLEWLAPGMSISAGSKIAEVGPAPENGNWPPHLHFQLMLDRMGWEGDFPGVALPDQAEIWKSICPPAQLYQRLCPEPKVKTSKESLLAHRKEKLGKSLSISYQEPLHILRGYKQYLYDHTGRRFLDTVNNVAHVGHEHPRIVRAAQRQMALLNTNTRYLHENILEFAEALLKTLPPELSVVHFVNSGSEANELALRMAQVCTGQKDMIAVEVGYHGNTGGCIDISSYKFDGKGGKGAPEHVQVVPIPDSYRGLYRDSQQAGHLYASHIDQAIETIHQKGRGLAGFICESILSCGGQIVLPKNYLKMSYASIRAAGGLCIADEVQVGFGRVGEAFWGFELQGIVPDIVTMGKPIGNGHPLAAVVCTQAVAEAFANGMEYFNTFGGNPVSCAIGHEVLRVIQAEGLQQNALEVGNYLKDQLAALQSTYPLIGDVRGHGLFLGFELVNHPESLEPAAEQARYLANRMRQKGILMSTDGPFHNVLKIKPPICFSRENADFLIERLDHCLQEDFMRAGL